jgi:Zn-dependent protease/predicted transcriptional regulator
MFGKRFTLLKLFGLAVHIDLSWIIIALLVTWSLAVGFFPSQYRNLSISTYWWMGVAGALGLFLSILFHEMSHSLVARRYGIPIKGITLFIFGGVAEMEEEPPSPKAEFVMAIAGPFSSIVLALGFYGVYIVGEKNGWIIPVNGVLRYLAFINSALAVFNLIPAFPLDGGRVLRSILWGWKKNLRWGTRIASNIGSVFGNVLIFLGVLGVIRGNIIGGIWQILIGMFLRDAARMSFRQLLARQALEGESIQRFMNPNPVTVPPSISLMQLVDDYIYRYPFKMFPVIQNGSLIGYVEMKQIKEIPRNEWPQRTVGEVAKPCSTDVTITPDTDAVRALSKMNQTRRSRLLVVENGRLVGILSLKDLLRFLSLKVELEESQKESAMRK